MIANYQSTLFYPHSSHITDEAMRRIKEHEPHSRVLEAYSHMRNHDGVLGGPKGEQKVSFNLQIVGEEDGKHTLTLEVTDKGILYTADKEVVIRIFDNVDPEAGKDLNILNGPIAPNEGLLHHEHQLLTAVSSGHEQSVEGLVYASAYVKKV